MLHTLSPSLPFSISPSLTLYVAACTVKDNLLFDAICTTFSEHAFDRNHTHTYTHVYSNSGMYILLYITIFGMIRVCAVRDRHETFIRGVRRFAAGCNPIENRKSGGFDERGHSCRARPVFLNTGKMFIEQTHLDAYDRRRGSRIRVCSIFYAKTTGGTRSHARTRPPLSPLIPR